MRRQPRPAKEPVLTGDHWRLIAGHGMVMCIAVLGAMAIAIFELGYQESRAVTISFLTLALAQLWHVLNMRDRARAWFRNEVTRNPWMWGAVSLCIGLILAAVYVPGLSGLLGITPPGAAGWAVILPMSFVPVALGPVVRLLAERQLANGPERRGASS